MGRNEATFQRVTGRAGASVCGHCFLLEGTRVTMSRHSSAPYQDSQDGPPVAVHDATRGLLNASLLGALFWFLMIGAVTWIAS